MYSFTVLPLATQVLVLHTNAQNDTNNSTISCEDPNIDLAIRWNSSTTRTMTALELVGERPAEPTRVGSGQGFYVTSDPERTWDITLRAQSMLRSDAPDSAREYYGQTMFLDTGDSNMTNIGSCHQILVGAASENLFQWTKEALERSMEEDKGDCTSILGDECIQAIKRNAAREAVNGPYRTASCEQMNNTLPPECTFLGPSEVTAKRQMNLTHLDNISRWRQNYPNSEFDRSLECQGTNMSSTHSVPMRAWIDYENAVRMPVIDIITFWPNLTSGLGVHYDGYEDHVHVELVCMRPDSNIAEGSDTPRSGSEIFNDGEARFAHQSASKESRASALNPVVLGWASAAIMSVVLVI